MRIAVIGTGHVGSTLGIGWARAGHDLIFGVRDPNSSNAQQPLCQAGGRVRRATVADSVASADVVALAIPWGAVANVLQTISAPLSGKILIDCTNPSRGLPGLDHSAGSGAEQVAKLAPNAKVVKAFNTTGFENTRDPRYPEGPVTMFCAGNDAEAKRVVLGLARDLGFDPVDAGGLSQSRHGEV